jgi:hypothetical protein
MVAWAFWHYFQFNVTNAIGFTYADRDAKQRWSNVTAGGWGGLASVGGLGGQILAGAVKNQVGRVFGSWFWVNDKVHVISLSNISWWFEQKRDH